MIKRITLLSLFIAVAALSVVYAAELAPGLSPELFKSMDAMVGSAMDGYNGNDPKKFYADYAKMMAGIATPQAFKALYTDNYKKKYGNIKSRKLIGSRSTVPAAAPNALLVYDAEMDKGHAVLSVNFFKEGGTYKIQQIQFNDK